MSIDAYIFTGPTFSIQDLDKNLYKINGNTVKTGHGRKIVFLPPVAEGDVYKIARNKPHFIAIIDGYFENRPAVWHKEILYAMSNGIHVLGAASMGALRAAELQPFGMEGIGKIYDSFLRGELTDDDEVTVCHGPIETGYLATSEAMVNIRATLQHAMKETILTEPEYNALIERAKNRFYKERNYQFIINDGQKNILSQEKRDILGKWIVKNKKNQKKEDAFLLMSELINRLQSPLHKKETLYRFEDTILWRRIRNANG